MNWPGESHSKKSANLESPSAGSSHGIDGRRPFLTNQPDTDHGTAAQNQSSINSDNPDSYVAAKAKRFRCKEHNCCKTYARKGDLSRHLREAHTDVEYLCPYASCLWHRAGHGFKRPHRLIKHLVPPAGGAFDGHPRALSHLDAKFIAVDYNDSLLSTCQMIVDLQHGRRKEETSAFVEMGVQDLGPLFEVLRSDPRGRMSHVWLLDILCCH